ncbi:unnamed protein product [Phytophthora fragariaefolia]|uniref:Unnamed protein product n=1 Tax=Phytophthora fragariaefolia TaxID=1490495 RepID=A0A9W6U014_9STRA|nr:unnamed protein product [Phytophthora fragariaefolia]
MPDARAACRKHRQYVVPPLRACQHNAQSWWSPHSRPSRTARWGRHSSILLHQGEQDSTHLVDIRKLVKLLRESDNEFCFVMVNNPAEDKAGASWRKLEGNRVWPLLHRSPDRVFRSELPDVPLSRQNAMDATIDVADSIPVHRKQFPLSAERKAAIQAWTREMVRAGIMRPSYSPYCSPTFCVRKKNGEWRIVHDFRGLNAKVRIPANAIPRKDDIFRDMAHGRLFSSMDLLWGFFQVKLRDDSIPFTAFATPDGLFEYLVTPMGVSSSPSCFNRLVQSIFDDYGDFCKTYFDDLAALEKILQRCADEQLFVKIEKCVFCSPEIPCLGDFIGRDGVRMDPAKSETIRDWPRPTTKQELQSFLGANVYVMRFCKGFADHVALLTDLVKDKRPRDEVHFNEQQLSAFAALKSKLAAPPVLAHPDFSQPFHVSVDASDFAVGGYLFQIADDQSERIIAYGGRKLSRAEQVYPTREKELLAALHAMRTWKVYLIDKPFFINTDHHTIENILQQQTCSHRLARWLIELALFQPLFRWVAGTTNVVADTMSRQPDDGTSRAISLSALIQSIVSPTDEEPGSLFAQRVTSLDIPSLCRQHYGDDPIFGPIIRDLSSATAADTRRLRRFSLSDGLLYFQIRPDTPRRRCIPDVADLRSGILYEEHDAPFRGHPGQAKTLLLLLTKYYWRGMARTVGKYVSSCEQCQRNKYVRGKPPGHLHPLEIPEGRWRDISIDVKGPLSKTSDDHDTVMVIIDRLTKRAHFLPTRETASAEDTARLFVDFNQRLHGLPSSITSDRDVKFTSKVWKQIMHMQDTRLHLGTAFKPSTDGQAEVTMKFVNEYLRHFINPHHTDWDRLLPFAEFAYNSRVHSSIGMTPFLADLGYQPRSVADYIIPASRPTRASRFVHHQQAILAEAQDAIVAAQLSWHASYDRNRPHGEFSIGDSILLDTKHLDLAHLGTYGTRKLSARYIGPYSIVSTTGPDTFKLDLPPGLRFHPEFHVSRLRRYQRDGQAARIIRVPPVLFADGSEGHLVKANIGLRTRHGTPQFLVRWLDTTLPSSWEPLTNLGQITDLIRHYLDTLQPTRAIARLSGEVSRV